MPYSKELPPLALRQGSSDLQATARGAERYHPWLYARGTMTLKAWKVALPSGQARWRAGERECECWEVAGKSRFHRGKPDGERGERE